MLSYVHLSKSEQSNSLHWYKSIRACTGFDGGFEDGEAIRRQMREIANLNINADEEYALAA